MIDERPYSPLYVLRSGCRSEWMSDSWQRPADSDEQTDDDFSEFILPLLGEARRRSIIVSIICFVRNLRVKVALIDAAVRCRVKSIPMSTVRQCHIKRRNL